ncbi:hypothetical protein [Paraburkholderia sp. Tr-20389]|uniref:hypothetical protein n=1 Tax=Paraburkholderia sp. Tr-20389 TaxID=2703903 RepID=UPI00198020D1|nr:hypothetical protein [Paraburkholderia sp. Tr-20389]
MMAAAGAAGEAVSRRIGDFAKMKYDEAAAAGDQAGMNAWKEGGTARAEMQAAGAAIVTGLAGGNAVGGAAGAAIASIAAGKLNELSGAIAGADPTGSDDVNKALGNIVSNVIATGAGAAIGGNAGAFDAYNVDRYNRQLHPDERQWAKDNAKDFAKFYEDKTGQAITPDQAQQMLLANGYRLVDDMASKGPGGNSTAIQFISQNANGLFTAPPAERANPGTLSSNLAPEQKALNGNWGTPPNFSVSLGANAQGQLFTIGLGAEIGVTLGIGDKPNMCVYGQACGNYGLGFYGGAGVSVTVSQGAPSSGSAISKGGFLAGGVGPVADITVTRDQSSGAISAGKGVIGIGGGLAGGGTQCKQYSACARGN